MTRIWNHLNHLFFVQRKLTSQSVYKTGLENTRMTASQCICENHKASTLLRKTWKNLQHLKRKQLQSNNTSIRLDAQHSWLSCCIYEKRSRKIRKCFRNIFLITWTPTRMLFCMAPSGNMAWTWGTTVELMRPPSMPIVFVSWRILVTSAK